jgi:hypothetical protein
VGAGDRDLASEQRRLRPEVINGLVAASDQVIDEGSGTEIEDAAERIARHHVRQQDTKAVDQLITRVAGLKDRTVAGPASLRLANYFSDADLPGFALDVYEANLELAKEAADVMADLRRELGRPTLMPSGRPDQITGRPPPPPIDPSRGP